MIKHKTVSEDKETPSHRMVFYFLSTVCDPPTVLFMGRDKHENEDLIKHGWPEDVWFHVDKVMMRVMMMMMRVREELNIVIAGLLCSRLPTSGTRTDPRKCESPQESASVL